MATLNITEHSEVASVFSRGASTFIAETHIVQEPPLAEQQIAIGVGSVQSAAFGANTRLVRVNTDTTCTLAWGKNPTAASTSATRMVAGQTEYFGVNAGDKLAVIQTT